VPVTTHREQQEPVGDSTPAAAAWRPCSGRLRSRAWRRLGADFRVAWNSTRDVRLRCGCVTHRKHAV